MARVRSLSAFQQRWIQLIRRKRNINKDRNTPVLNDGINSRRESGSQRDDFVAGFQPTITEFGRSKSGESHEIRRRPGIHQRTAPQSEKPGEAAFELFGEPARGEPAVQCGIDQITQVTAVQYFAGNRYRRLSFDEGPVGKLLRKYSSAVEYPLPQLRCLKAHFSILVHFRCQRRRAITTGVKRKKQSHAGIAENGETEEQCSERAGE